MKRTQYINQIKAAFSVHSAVALLGPRQCGKTTLARDYIADLGENFPPQNYFDLENPTDLARLTEAQLTLAPLQGLIVIDEIQRIPELFPLLRVLIDEPNRQRQFLILGSASRELIRQTSETLAGRIGYLELSPFSYPEVDNLSQLWLQGGFPRSYLTTDAEKSYLWREHYVRTFLEVDIPSLGIQIPPPLLRRFWMMLAHYHGGIFNASEIGRSLSLNHKTVQYYVDILTGTFMIRQLPAWFENISKRQIKAPKIYFRDSGIFHTLLGIDNTQALFHHPKLGSSWEGFAIEQIIRHHQTEMSEYYFWGTHAHAELDLLLIKRGKRLGFEFKYTDSPRRTKSMLIAQQDLQLDKLTVIYPGKYEFPLGEQMVACGLESYLSGF